MPNKKILITHDDLDGVGNIILLKHFNYQIDDYIICSYTDIENNLFDYSLLDDCKELVFTDFSPSTKDFRDFIEENNIKVTIYDHHESAKEDIDNWSYSNKTFIYGGKEKAGTLLFYENEFKGSSLDKPIVEEFVNLVDTYDNWKVESPIRTKAEDLNRLLYKTLNYGSEGKEKYTFFVDIMLNKFSLFNSFEFNKFEAGKIQADKDKEDKLFNEFLSGKRKIITRKDEKGRYFCLIECTSKISAICKRLLEKYKKVDYIICFNDYDKDVPKISLRARTGINLLEFEGVKGHQESAGLECPGYALWEKIKKGEIYSLTLKEVTEVDKTEKI